MKIAIASDHGGYELKENIKKYLESRDIEIVDLGTYSEESVDYPAFADRVAKRIGIDPQDRGILICGSAQGVAMRANKCSDVRAAVLWNE